ncbi:MAG TPA: class I SAM-dependent rRNA methyltransferase [Thermoanaerobaculia bacterium]|nr:class I SAM-dependent rRNA methyltransferase [Thermoanaerobaculia bacterium]
MSGETVTAGAVATATVRLAPGRDAPLRDGHPWVFSGAVAATEGPAEAPLARVVAADGRVLGSGLHSPRSQIRVRMVTGGEEAERPVDRQLFSERLAAAVRLRRTVVPAATTGYRVVNAEGDGLPGWVVDRFGEVLVSQVTSAGLEAIRDEAYAALAEAFAGLAIVQANDVAGRRPEGLAGGDEAIAGEVPAEVLFTESGLTFSAETAGGQKTGFYCDQRENRRLAERLAGGRTVLDLFAHGGAFGLYALRGGADRVVHVESSPRLIERGERLYPLNSGLPADRAEWVKANVFEDLRQREERYGLIVCDPPPLARRRGDVDRAARAYKDLNRLAFARLEAGGFLLTFSCSGAVDGKLFRQVLFAAAVEAGVRVRLLAPLAAAPDHPVAITHPQGEYLKGWWCEVW